MENVFKILHRDLDIARAESKCGYVHTYFWICVLRKFLNAAKCEVRSPAYNANGTHTTYFTDSVTGVKYKISVEPVLEVKK
jgi:hypothetical protein